MEPATLDVHQLQKGLAHADLLTDRANSGAGLGFLVVRLRSVSIKMYQETGHQLAHIHIDYADSKHVASFGISPAVMLAGNLPRHHEREVVQWIENRSDALLRLWNTVQEGKDVQREIALVRGE